MWLRAFDSVEEGAPAQVRVIPHGDDFQWFGKSSTWAAPDYYATVQTGPIVNYIQARIISFLEYLQHNDPLVGGTIDPNEVFITGDSNGGSGSLQFAINYPDYFSYVTANCPPVNLVSWAYDHFWGSDDDDTILIDFIGPKIGIASENYSGRIANQWFNLPNTFAELDSIDLPWIGVEHGGLDDTVPHAIHGRMLYPGLETGKHGFSGGLDGDGGHYGSGLREGLPQLRSIRLDQAYPAFTNVQHNADLPLPASPSSSNYTFNLQFMWSTSTWSVGGVQDQVDEVNNFEMVLATTGGSDDRADVTLRRLQRFATSPGATYLVTNQAPNDINTVYQTLTVVADSNGVLTIPDLIIKPGSEQSGGNRIVVAPTDPVVVPKPPSNLQVN
jgi:hypothetical protein